MYGGPLGPQRAMATVVTHMHFLPIKCIHDQCVSIDESVVLSAAARSACHFNLQILSVVRVFSKETDQCP